MTTTYQIGERVLVEYPADHVLFTTKWWPKFGETVTGTVQKVFKNGRVAVAIDQLPNRSEDGKSTMNVPAEHLRHADGEGE